MPEYTGVIRENGLVFLRPDLLGKWEKKNEGLWFKATLELIGKCADSKTSAQLGYYWGLLVPEIRDELARQGHTNTVRFSDFEREVPYNKHSTHELLTGLCGQVGPDGILIRLSEMVLAQAMRFIDNVLEFAIVSLAMNEVNLRAMRPE